MRRPKIHVLYQFSYIIGILKSNREKEEDWAGRADRGTGIDEFSVATGLRAGRLCFAPAGTPVPSGTARPSASRTHRLSDNLHHRNSISTEVLRIAILHPSGSKFRETSVLLQLPKVLSYCVNCISSFRRKPESRKILLDPGFRRGDGY